MKAKRIMVYIILIFSVVYLFSNIYPETTSWPKILNLDFENSICDNWFVGGDYIITQDNTEVFHGKQSLRFTSLEGASNILPGFAASRLPVIQFRGKRIRLSGALKTSNVTDSFSLWLRADAGEDPMVFNQLYNDSPKGNTSWKRFSVELDIPSVTTAIYFGAVLYGEGTAWVDNLSIETLPFLDSHLRTIGGTVQDKNNNPVHNALIIAKSPYHETALACMSSDKNGSFTFHLPIGTYMLTATTPQLTAGILPFQDYNNDVRDIVLTVGKDPGFFINGKVQAPLGKITADSYVIVNLLKSIDSTIFYVPIEPDGRFKITLPIGNSYRIDLDSPFLKAVPVMVQNVSNTGNSCNCSLEAIEPNPAPKQIVSWIRENAVNINTPEAGHGYSDLIPLKEIIGNARVVAMGEATHGTREIFQMKHRFLEFLVEEMDFTVFAMEGIDMQEFALNDYVLNGRGDIEKIPKGFPPVWCTEEIIDMIKWMRTYNANPAHKKKVKFLGIEPGDSRTAIIYIQRYLKKVDPDTLKKFESLFNFMSRSNAYDLLIKYSLKEYNALQSSLKKILSCFDFEKANYVARSSLQEWEKSRQCVRLLQQFAEYSFVPGDNDYHFLNLRSQFMAENTQWILNTEPPGTKIMIWAHNFHISLSPYPGYPFIFMGMHLRRILGNDYLAIGFVFNRGSFQGLDFTSPNKEHRVIKSFTVGPYPGSYGLAMSRTGLQYFFLDLRRIPGKGIVHNWFTVPRVFKWINYIYDTEKDIKYLFQLPKLFDAIIFIDKTTRSRPLPPARHPSFPY